MTNKPDKPAKKPTLQASAIALVADRIRTEQDQLKESEANTRTRLVNPILQAYGWKLDSPAHVRLEQGHAQPGRPDATLLDPERHVPVAPLEAKKLASAEMDAAAGQVDGYTDGPGKNARVTITTDGDRWVFRRPGHRDGDKPLAEVQISQDKPEDAARTLTRVLRPSSIIGGKLDKELDTALAAPEAAPDRRLNTYTVVDVETTGFGNKDRIIEFGAVKVVDGREVDSMQTFINPQRGIPKQITELTGITNADVRTAPAMNQVRNRIQAFIGHGPVIAHNAAFDKRMLANEGVVLSEEPYDTMKLSRRVYEGEPSHSLENITKRLGIYKPGNHRADHDARLTGQVFNQLLDKSEQLTGDKRRSLVRETSRRRQTPETALLISAGNSRTPNFSPLKQNPREREGRMLPRGRSGAAKRPISPK